MEPAHDASPALRCSQCKMRRATIGGADRDSAFNVTEGLSAALGRGTVHSSQTVSIDISNLLPGSSATLVVRLVNNDSDVDTTVRIPRDSPITVSLGAPSSDEGDSVTFEAQYADCGTAATHTASIAWGDGLSSAADVSTSGTSVTLSGSHVYDDNGSYGAVLAISNNGSPAGSARFTVPVTNVAPSLSVNQTFELVTGSNGVARLDVVLTGSFTDPGFDRPSAPTAESFTVAVDWGDGTTQLVSPSVTLGSDGVLTSGTFTTRYTWPIHQPAGACRRGVRYLCQAVLCRTRSGSIAWR
jgi:hypothetical protein